MKTSLYEARKWNFRKTVAGREASVEWDSLEAFFPDMEYTRKVSVAQTAETDGYCTGRDAYRWLGIESGGFMGFIEKLQKGWPELRATLERKLSDIQLEVPRFPTTTEVRRRKRVRGEHGDTLRMTSVWNGDLDHAWERPVRQVRIAPNNKCVTLVFEVGSHCGITNDQAMWRAALCMLLVRSLAQAGRTFEIWVQSSSSGTYTRQEGYSPGPDKLWLAWCVKKAAEPVVLDRLCSMVSVGMLRTCAFIGYDCSPHKLGYGYGMPANTGIPHSLRERQSRGETVLRIGECYTKADCLSEYKRAWQEVEAAVEKAA